MSIKAIETKYKGYRFRSRLEARWAVFFYALGLQWEYEPEGFDLGDGVWYLPDFKVVTKSGVVCWYEVKPKCVWSDGKYSKFSEIVEKRGQRTLLISGDPIDSAGVVSETSVVADHVCPECLMLHFGAVSRDSESVYECGVCGYNMSYDHDFGRVEDPSHFAFVMVCAEKARSARFEHGEVTQ